MICFHKFNVLCNPVQCTCSIKKGLFLAYFLYEYMGKSLYKYIMKLNLKLINETMTIRQWPF